MAQDPWDHPDKEGRATLRLARSYGWPTPEVTTNHRRWQVRCPGPLDPSRERATCEFYAYSTAMNSEKYARLARLTIERCPHESGSPAANARRRIIEAHALLEKAWNVARQCHSADDPMLMSMLDSIEARLDACVDALSSLIASESHVDGEMGQMVEVEAKLQEARRQLRKTDKKNPNYQILLQRRADLVKIASDLEGVVAALEVAPAPEDM